MNPPTTITQLRRSHNPAGLHQRYATSEHGQTRLPQELSELNPADYLRMTIAANEVMQELGLTKLPQVLREELRTRYAKRCGGCRAVLPLFCFPGNKASTDRLHSECRECNSSQKSGYRQRNADEIRGRYRDWYQENAEAEQQRVAAWRAENPGYWESYYYTEGGRSRLLKQLNDGYHRAIRAGNPANKITPQELLSHWEAAGINPLTCYLTNEELTPLTRSVDHVLAISNGGSHTLENLLPCTITANYKKNTKPADEAFELLNTNEETTTND